MIFYNDKVLYFYKICREKEKGKFDYKYIRMNFLNLILENV